MENLGYGAVPDPRERVVLDPDEAGWQAMYHLMNATVAPRPVAWVSTLSADGVPNVAPHSYTTVFSLQPPVVGFVSVGRKDSTTNVEATGEFVLNIASDVVGPPRVGEAPVSFETRLLEVIPVGNCFLVLGEVVRVHVATDVWRDGRVDPELLRPVLRLAGSMFARMGPTFNLTRPTYDDVLAGRVAQLPEDIL